MSLEDFAQVVEMMDDKPSIKDISSMFEQLDEDRGGTLSLNELRTGAIGMGMSGLKNSEEEQVDAKELKFSELSDVQKTDVRKLLGFPPEDPSVDRLRAMLRELEGKQHTVETIKQCTEDIQAAVNMCVLAAAIGPPCTSALDPLSPFNKKQQFELAERPLLPWGQLLTEEKSNAQELGFDEPSWDSIRTAADEESEDEDDEAAQSSKRTKASRKAYEQTLTKVQNILGLVENPDYVTGRDKAIKAKHSDSALAEHRSSMPVDFAFEVLSADKKKKRKKDKDEKMFDANMTPKQKSRYHALAFLKGQPGRLDPKLKEKDTEGKEHLADMYGESADKSRRGNTAGRDFGYHHVWMHRWSPQYNGGSSAKDGDDADYIGGALDDTDIIAQSGLITEWVTDEEHIARYRTAPQVVHRSIRRRLNIWKTKQQQLSSKQKFFGKSWDDLKKLETDEESWLDSVKHLLNQEKEKDAWTPTEEGAEGESAATATGDLKDAHYQQRWDMSMLDDTRDVTAGRWLVVFETEDWNDLLEDDQKHIGLIWQANNVEASDDVQKASEWKQLREAMVVEKKACGEQPKSTSATSVADTTEPDEETDKSGGKKGGKKNKGKRARVTTKALRMRTTIGQMQKRWAMTRILPLSSWLKRRS